MYSCSCEMLLWRHFFLEPPSPSPPPPPPTQARGHAFSATNQRTEWYTLGGGGGTNEVRVEWIAYAVFTLERFTEVLEFTYLGKYFACVMRRSTQNFNIPPPPPPPGKPRAFELLKIGLFKFPPPMAKLVFKCPTLSLDLSVKCPS